MEEKHIRRDHRHNHHHDHHKQQQAPTGSESHHAIEPHHIWVCHRCGWAYPNPHPSAKHRRNHRKHCGKIEGFPLIASGHRETQGGSSDEELTDDEHQSTDQQKPMPSEEKSISPQTQTSAPTPDINISNRNIKSSEADLGNAGQKREAPDNAILNISPSTDPEAKKIDSDQFDQNGKEATKSILGDEVHGLNISGTIEPSDKFKGPDWYSFEEKSNIFLKEAPDIDSSHVIIGDIGPREFPVKDYHTMSDYPKVKNQNNQTDLHVPEDSIPPIVQVYPESDDTVDGLGLQIMNDRVKQHIEIAGERQNILEEAKRSLVKLQNTGHTQQPKTFGMPATIPTHATPEHNSEISLRKAGIASVLEQTSFKEENSDESKIKVPLAEKTLVSADQKIYDLFQTSHQVSGDTIQDISISEQDIIHDVAYPSGCGKVSNAEKSPGHILSQKENSQSLAFEPETGKLLEHPSSTALIESIFVKNVHPEVTKRMISSQEKSSVEQVVSDKREESDISPPISAVYEIHKNGELEKKRKDPSSEDLDKTSCQKLDLQASSDLFISDQELSSADSLTSEFTKAGALQRVENNGITNPGITEIRFLDTESRKDESTQRNIIMTDKEIGRNTKPTVMALEKLPKTSLEDVVEQKSVVSEFLLPDARDTDLSFQGIINAESQAQFSREETKHDSNGQSLEQSIVDKKHQIKEAVLDTFLAVHPATTVTVDNSLHLDDSKRNHENALKYSTDDMWGNRSESTENIEPALWEKLLEKDVEETINQETCQQLGNAGSSPVNPFIHEYSFSNKMEPQIFSTEGIHAQTSEQLNNGSTEVGRKHPSSTKGVDEDPLVSQLGWFPSFPEVTNESHERKFDNESRTDASEMIPGALELPYTHLSNSPPKSSNSKPEEKKKVSGKSIWSLCVCCSGAS